jgi:hypothetical protein
MALLSVAGKREEGKSKAGRGDWVFLEGLASRGFYHIEVFCLF